MAKIHNLTRHPGRNLVPHVYPPSPNARVPLVALAKDLDIGRLNLDRVLFLDSDGVLHPECGDPSMHFCFAFNLYEVLQSVPLAHDIPIVISSTWRMTTTLVQMREHFPPAMRHQIVGVTPDLDATWEPSKDHNRQSEIEAWMSQFSPGGQWLAIDDRASLFNENCENLFCVPDYRPGLGAGLNLQVCDDLKLRLHLFMASAGKRREHLIVL